MLSQLDTQELSIATSTINEEPDAKKITLAEEDKAKMHMLILVVVVAACLILLLLVCYLCFKLRVIKQQKKDHATQVAQIAEPQNFGSDIESVTGSIIQTRRGTIDSAPVRSTKINVDDQGPQNDQSVDRAMTAEDRRRSLLEMVSHRGTLAQQEHVLAEMPAQDDNATIDNSFKNVGNSESKILAGENSPISIEQMKVVRTNLADERVKPDNVQLEFGQPEGMTSTHSKQTVSTLQQKAGTSPPQVVIPTERNDTDGSEADLNLTEGSTVEKSAPGPATNMANLPDLDDLIPYEEDKQVEEG